MIMLTCGCRPPCHGLHAPRVTVYRVVVSFRAVRRGRMRPGREPQHKGAYTPVEFTTAAVVSWTPDTTAEPWRAGYGSFCYAGAIRAVQAARAALADARTLQVSIRTNQDRAVLVYNRHDDGRVTCYRAEGE